MLRVEQTYTNDEVDALFPELLRVQRGLEKRLMNPELEDKDTSARAYAVVTKVLKPLTAHVQRLRDLAARKGK